MKKIVVLMSSYNGSRYIEHQLDSILAQQGVELEIYIRDDGSNDDTLEIINRYQQKYDNVFCIEGANIGAWRSFLELLKLVDEQADYYAFADQDDEWMEDKLISAVNRLEEAGKKFGSSIPLLYCSNKTLCDDKLNPVHSRISYDMQYVPSLGNALVQNICTGCTAVINQELREILNSATPEKIYMHDWWFYLTAVYFGRVVYDNTSHIKYRLHGKNVHGTQTTKLGRLKHRLIQLTAKREDTYLQAEEFRKCYGVENLLIDDFIKSKKDISARIRLASDNQIKRQEKRDYLLNKFLILTGKA